MPATNTAPAVPVDPSPPIAGVLLAFVLRLGAVVSLLGALAWLAVGLYAAASGGDALERVSMGGVAPLLLVVGVALVAAAGAWVGWVWGRGLVRGSLLAFVAAVLWLGLGVAGSGLAVTGVVTPGTFAAEQARGYAEVTVNGRTVREGWSEADGAWTSAERWGAGVGLALNGLLLLGLVRGARFYTSMERHDAPAARGPAMSTAAFGRVPTLPTAVSETPKDGFAFGAGERDAA